MLASIVIDSLFLLCPMSELPLLDQSARLDMLDYFAAEMEAKGTNLFGGTSVIEEKSDCTLRIRLTEVSTWEMRLLDNGQIRCTHNISAPDVIQQSQTHLYSQDWILVKMK